MLFEEEEKLDGHQKKELSNKINEPTEKASPSEVRSRWREWKPLENDIDQDQHGTTKKKNLG
jgi:hypothetical protein